MAHFAWISTLLMKTLYCRLHIPPVSAITKDLGSICALQNPKYTFVHKFAHSHPAFNTCTIPPVLVLLLSWTSVDFTNIAYLRSCHAPAVTRFPSVSLNLAQFDGRIEYAMESF